MSDWYELYRGRYHLLRTAQALQSDGQYKPPAPAQTLQSLPPWSDVDALLKAALGDYSACVCAADGSIRYAYQADVVRPAASLIKVVIALTVYHYATALSIIDLDQTVELTETVRVEGEGTVDHAPTGSWWSYNQLIAHMLHESDNTAGNLLLDLLGHHLHSAMDGVNSYARAVGTHATLLQRRFMDLTAARAGRDNLTCALDMCQIFLRLLWSNRPGTLPYGGNDSPNMSVQLVQPGETNLSLPGRVLQQKLPALDPILQYLFGSAVPDKLVAGVPADVQVAHKVGDLPHVEHDVGIVYAPGGPYVVALLSVRLPDAQIGQRTLAAASHLIYQHMTETQSHGT